MTDHEVETLLSCPLCGSSELRRWRAVRDVSRAEVAPALVYVRCRRCGLVLLRDRLVERDLGALYADDYEPYVSVGPVTTGGRSNGLRGLIGSAFPDPAQRASDALYREARREGRLLDFGCGSPRFLMRARAQGWSAVGVDFPDSVLKNVRAEGFTAHSVEEARSTLEPSSFDVIRMNHVLEHLYDPRDTLSWLRGLLRDDGVLHIAVPNPSGVSATLFRQHWMGMEPRHVMLYPPRTIKRLLLELGFRDVTVVHESLSKDAVRSAGLLVASHTSQTVQDAMRWSDNRVAANLLRPAAWLAARLGVADRYHAFARA